MTVSSIAIGAVQFYRAKGISKDAAVAIVSVLWYESKLKPGGQGSQSTETPGALNAAGAYGIASWNGPRQQALSSFAIKHGLIVGELDTQLAFVLTEMANSYYKSWTAINSADNYAQIIPIIVAEYENPKDHQAEINGAMTFASELYPAIPEAIPAIPKAAPATAPKPSAQPSAETGAQTMPPIDPALIATLVQLFAPIAESLLAGLVKGIIQQLATMQEKQAPIKLPIPLGQLPGFDPGQLAKLIAAEMAALQGGPK